MSSGTEARAGARLTRFGLRRRVALLVIQVVVMVMLLTWESLDFRVRSHAQIREVRSELTPSLLAARGARTEFDRLNQVFEQAATQEDDAHLLFAAASLRTLEAELDTLAEHSPELEDAVESARELTRRYYQRATLVTRGLIRGERGEDPLEDMARMRADLVALRDQLDALVSGTDQRVDTAFDTFESSMQQSLWFGLAVHIIGLLLLVVSSLWIMRGPLRSLDEFRAGFRRLAAGSFGTRFTPRSDDEFGRLCEEGNSVATDLEQLDRERRAVEMSLRRSGEELKAVNARLNDFVRISSHDLKEPARGMHAYAKIILEDHEHELPAEAKRHVHTIIRLSKRMLALIEALLKYVELGRHALHIAPTNLDQVCRDSIADMAPLLQRQGVDVRIPRPLPTVACDRVLVGEILANLVTNAAKYNDKEERWVEISYEERADGGRPRYRFCVADNGIGIAEKHRTLIFQSFKRLNSSERFEPGTGLGLSIVSDMVARHGGTVTVESEIGKGSVFSFTLEEGRA